MKIAAIVPVYNEEKSIANVVNDINSMAAAAGLNIVVVVVNDCSKDTTADIISKLDCIEINLPVNLGIGGAVQTGFKYAYQNNFDLAIQVDGDGQHPASQIPKIINEAIRMQADVMIGSRFILGIGYQSSSMRRLGINYFKFLIRLLVGETVTDATSGFRLINRRVLEVVSEYYPDEYPEPESIIMYSLKGFRVAEIQVEMKERQGGVSSINTLSSIYYMFKVSLAIVYTFTRIKFQK